MHRALAGLILGSGLLWSLGAWGCGSSVPKDALSATPASSPIGIVASTTILADWARQVAGEEAKVQSLIRPGTDPHIFDPSPGDVAAIARADVVLLNGLGLEPWAEALVGEVTATTQVVRLGELVDAIAWEGDERHPGGGELDPHFWLDPLRAVQAMEAIRDALSRADIARADAYRANAASYIAQLRQLHEWIQKQIETLPVERRLLVTNHDSFRYFARRYGFRIIGAVIPGVTTEQEPSARGLGELVEAIRGTGAPAVFLETTSNPKLAESLAREANVRVVNSLYTGSLGPAGSPASTFLEMMRYDTSTLLDALR